MFGNETAARIAPGAIQLVSITVLQNTIIVTRDGLQCIISKKCLESRS